jgi:hypothetical protein
MNGKFTDSVYLLKQTIQKAVSNALDNFERDTGMSPSAIDLDLVATTQHGDRLNRYSLAQVVVRFRL